MSAPRICGRAISSQHLLMIAMVCATIACELTADAANLFYSALRWNGDVQTPRLSTIHSINANGSQDVKILDLGGDTTYPIPSFDGQWLYFQSNSGGAQYSVYRSHVDGSGVTNLSNLAQLGAQWQGATAAGPALSGDSTKLTYVVHDGTTGKQVVANADGTSAQFAAPSLGYTYMGSLNQTGNQIVFSGPAQDYRLLTAQLPSGQPQILTLNYPNSYGPQFTPNGDTVIFFRNDGDIYSVNVDTHQVNQLTQGNNYYQFSWTALDVHGSSDGPKISPDGDQIAYIGMVGNVSQVFTMNLDGTNKHQHTFGTGASHRVAWSPDGAKLAFTTLTGSGYPQLFTVNAAGGALQQLTNISGGGVYFVQWAIVPEPGALTLLATGVMVAAGYRRWQRVKSKRISVAQPFTTLRSGDHSGVSSIYTTGAI